VIPIILCVLGLDFVSASGASAQGTQTATQTAVGELRREAQTLERLVTSPFAKDFLRATASLPSISSRTLYFNESKRAYLTGKAYAAMKEPERKGFKPFPVDESFYYTTKYGSPLAYARPLDLLGLPSLGKASSLRILDFGYGTVGHLRLLASLGADVTGVDVDPLLPALYSAGEDQGSVKNPRGRPGALRLIDGRFPADASTKSTVGGRYDLILSKNTLKKGYVHPDRPVDSRRRLDLGMDDVAFLKVLHECLAPGGHVLIYNICPAPSAPGQPYKNWADGRCPFPRELWLSAGFRVVAYDRDDSETIRRVGQALGWDRGAAPIDLKADLFASYSLLEKPKNP
jgi:SAM-dependent methyltransferase